MRIQHVHLSSIRRPRARPKYIEQLEPRKLFTAYPIPNGVAASLGDRILMTSSLVPNNPVIFYKLNDFQFGGIPAPADAPSGDPFNIFRIDGHAGQETITLDFSHGAFSWSPADPVVQITGSDPALQNTLILRDTNGNDSISQFPSGDPNYPNAILFTDFDTNTFTETEYAAGVSNLIIDTPEPASLTLVSAGTILLLARPERKEKKAPH
jgi:hypothetical protein